jgi:hypothetical protein
LVVVSVAQSMCVLTEQPSGHLQKQHQYNQTTSNKEIAKQFQKGRENIMQQHHSNATVKPVHNTMPFPCHAVPLMF